MKPGTRILDICSKTGLYALYAAYSVYKSRSSQSQGLFDMLTDEESLKLRKDILENNIFAVCRTHIAEKITRTHPAWLQKGHLRERTTRGQSCAARHGV